LSKQDSISLYVDLKSSRISATQKLVRVVLLRGFKGSMTTKGSFYNILVGFAYYVFQT